jgi:hypothetical protein
MTGGLSGKVGESGARGPEGAVGSPLRWAFVLVALIPVLWLTLRPAPEASFSGAGIFCLICGSQGMANAIRNVVLFVPLGAALALLLGPGARALVAVFLVTAAIESLQFHVPGRNPGLGDLLANFLGGAISVGLVRSSPGWTRLQGPGAALASLVSAAAAWAILLGVAVLFVPDLPRSSYFAHLNPDLAHLEHYDGAVESVRLSGAPMRIGRIDDPEGVRTSLLHGEPVEVVAVAGHSPPALAPLFMITSGAQEEVILLGIDRDDLVARVRYRGNTIGFDGPDLRARGTLEGMAPGDRIEAAFVSRGGASCLTLGDRTECGLGPRLEQGWALLLYPGGAPAWAMGLFDLVWMAGLFFPFGLFARRHPFTWAGAGLVLLALASPFWLWAVAPSALAGLLGVGLGIGTGLLASRWVPRRGTQFAQHHSPDPSSEFPLHGRPH